MSSFNSALNPNVVKTALDKVFFQEFSLFAGPGEATVETPAIFKQDSMDSSAVIEEVFKGVGLWTEKGQEQDVASATPRVSNQITFTAVTFAKSVDIPKEFFDDGKHGVYERMVRDMGETARITKNMTGFGIYRNATGTTLTADGVALGSASHTTINGDTVSNILTSSALTETTLNNAIVKLAEMKAQDGTIRGTQIACLLVPPALFKKAKEITASELRSATANNDMNVYKGIYGIEVYTSPYLGAAAGGSDTTWFALGRNHSITRWTREGVSTYLNDYTATRNHNYVYGGRYRETYGALDYSGIIVATA